MTLNQTKFLLSKTISIPQPEVSFPVESPTSLQFTFIVGKNEAQGSFTLNLIKNEINYFTLIACNQSISSINFQEVERINIENKNSYLILGVRDVFLHFTTLTFELNGEQPLSSLAPDTIYSLKGTYEYFFDCEQICLDLSGVVRCS